VSAAGRVIIVGGGILGTMHALVARRRGLQVVQVERELVARGASVRNFGLVWVGARAGGAELELALRARSLWEAIVREVVVPGAELRAAGSLTVATDEAELAVLEQACTRDDARARQWELLDAATARGVNPELSDEVAGALRCRADAIVEPRTMVAALRQHLSREASPPSSGPSSAHAGYAWLPGREVVELSERAALDDRGQRHEGDRVFVCTGATLSGLVARYADVPKTRRVRLQMLETAPYPGELTTAVADGDSLRYYPAFDLPARASLAPQDALAAGARAQLLLVQRVGGGLTIGDTHDYAEPFSFDVEEGIYDHLLAKAARLLRRRVPPVTRRWAGVYSDVSEKDGPLYWRQEVLPGVEVVTAVGGRGMTCSPAIAEDSLDALVAR
jgi:FAD dependent oxidoreductase TIGR03364